MTSLPGNRIVRAFVTAWATKSVLRTPTPTPGSAGTSSAVPVRRTAFDRWQQARSTVQPVVREDPRDAFECATDRYALLAQPEGRRVCGRPRDRRGSGVSTVSQSDHRRDTERAGRCTCGIERRSPGVLGIGFGFTAAVDRAGLSHRAADQTADRPAP